MGVDQKSTSQLSKDRSLYASSWWGGTLGLGAAVLLVGILYFSFSGNLIEPPTVPPPAAPMPTSTGPVVPVQPSVPSTK